MTHTQSLVAQFAQERRDILNSQAWRTLSGSSLTLTGVGLVTVRAIQAGSDLYEAATPVERSFTVAQGAQTIDFAILPDDDMIHERDRAD